MGRTKGSGQGSIWKTDKGWRGQITLEGHRYSVSGKTKKDVIVKLDNLKQCNNIYRKDISVNDFIKLWVKKKIEPKVNSETSERLLINFENHIFPYIGQTYLQDLTKDLLEETYARAFQAKSGRKYKVKEYSHSTVNNLSVQFKKALYYAVELGMIDKNPHEGVELHKLRPPKKVSSYTSADQRKIINYCKEAKGTSDHIYYFLISTGMRFGEAVALTWDDIDLKTGMVNINKIGVCEHGSMRIEDRTKTPASCRKIIVGENIIEWLKWHRDQIDMDANWRNLVFPNNRGNILIQSNAIARWKRICAILDIEYQGIHSLRHTWATSALESEVDIKTISAMMGHKNVITTMNIYQDVLDSQKQKCANKMNSLF